MRQFERCVIAFLIAMPGPLALLSCFMWAFFGFEWWKPLEGNEGRRMTINLFHIFTPLACPVASLVFLAATSKEPARD